MSNDDVAYFRQRAVEEREKAAAASQGSAADVHLALAARYEALVDQARARPALGDFEFTDGLSFGGQVS